MNRTLGFVRVVEAADAQLRPNPNKLQPAAAKPVFRNCRLERCVLFVIFMLLNAIRSFAYHSKQITTILPHISGERISGNVQDHLINNFI